MKKTIAILLVLVLAGAGLFAAVTSGSADLHLSVTIAPINQMAITKTDTPHTWALPEAPEDDFSSAYDIDNAYGLTDANETLSTIAYLQARSNNRNGFSIGMSATPLKATQGSDIQYIDYTVECGGVAIATVDGVVTATGTVVDKIEYENDGIAFLPITAIDLQLTETIENAADGEYSASITFSYTAS